MTKPLRWKVFLILGLTALSVYFAFPLGKRIDLGLDLKGGMHLVLRVDTRSLSADAKKDAVERALEVVRNRIDQFGVGEVGIQRQGLEEIVVQLPGITDRKRALEIIGKTALLEFKLVNEEPEKLKLALEGNVPEGYELKNDKEGKPLLLEKQVQMTGQNISDAMVQFDRSGFGAPYVSLKFNSQGARDFAKLTAQNVGRRLAIVLDGNVNSAPVIREAIPSGEAQISGRFTYEEASDLAIILRVGALPAPMRVEEERTIGPLLGQDSIKAGIKASLVGLALVLLFMGIYYLTSGLIADVALVLNLLYIVGALGLLKVILPGQQVTLTLPGIAGIILTLGMAVDANVLINERIREEFKVGRTLIASIHNGYHKAFSAIFDANVTTLIAAFFLFQFGTGPIRGFAVTLVIGLLISMFTAIVVTRAILELLVSRRIIKSLPMLSLIKETKIDFIAKRKIFYAISLAVIIVGMFTWIKKGPAAYGVDFAGGQLQEYKFSKPVSLEALRGALKSSNLADASIQQFKDNPEVVIVRTASDTATEVEKAFTEKLADNKFDILRVENVGPVVGQQLRKRAIMAIVFALGGILVYVGLRFKHFDFAFAGVVALLHDVAVAAGLVVLSGRQIDLLIVTALLTIAGYSINDTIVIYDRVREVTRNARKLTLKEIINLSVNQTLSRTILTSLVTLLVVLSLFLFGGEILNGLSFCLLVGFISGVYSTIFIASPLVLAWQRHR
ncbi:MAG: protein translocase subunit SecD [Candidatus Omnitrophota bacterium]